jgi:hypothetical protein
MLDNKQITYMLKYGPPTKLQKTLLPPFNHYIAEIYGVLLPLVIYVS